MLALLLHRRRKEVFLRDLPVSERERLFLQNPKTKTKGIRSGVYLTVGGRGLRLETP